MNNLYQIISEKTRQQNHNLIDKINAKRKDPPVIEPYSTDYQKLTERQPKINPSYKAEYIRSKYFTATTAQNIFFENT